MAKIVPTSYTAPSLIQFGTGEDIDSEDYNAIVEAQNHLWTTRGARLGGLILDPIFTTTSATYTQTTGSSSRNLSGWSGIIRPRRRVLSAGTYYYAIVLEIIGANVDVRAYIGDETTVRDSSGYYSTSLVSSVVGATFASDTTTLLVPVTADYYAVTLEAKYNAAGTASLAQVNIYEGTSVVSYLP